MKPPFDLVRLRLELASSRAYGDPVEPYSRKYEIALRPIECPNDWINLVDKPKVWCREIVDDSEHWSFRMDRGPNHAFRIPTYWFSNIDTAFAFKMRWMGL